MVTLESVEKQLKKLKFNTHAWGRSEARELPNILLEDEEIYEVVNGYYEAGFALLVATDVRVLLVDKKPLNYLTVEDFRFDMINEIDYSHRLIGAHISLSAGNKNLQFTSFNQQRLRKLISHVQHCIADSKKKQNNHAQDQKQHLEQINQQLQAYLLSQHKHQEELREHLTKQAQGAGSSEATSSGSPELPPVAEPDPALKDYLFAQSLLAQYQAQQAGVDTSATIDETTKLLEQTVALPVIEPPTQPVAAVPAPDPQTALPPVSESRLEQGGASSEMADLYAEGMQEIFGKHDEQQAQKPEPVAAQTVAQPQTAPAPEAADAQPIVAGEGQIYAKSRKKSGKSSKHSMINPLEVNPLRIAYSKLPMALRNRRFGRPSFHSHSQADIRTDRPVTQGR